MRKLKYRNKMKTIHFVALVNILPIISTSLTTGFVFIALHGPEKYCGSMESFGVVTP